MAKRGNKMQNTISQWAYQSRKNGNKAGDIIKSIEEVSKTLDSVKIKKR